MKFVKSTRSWHIATYIRTDGYALTKCHRQVKATKVTNDIEDVEQDRRAWARCSECRWDEL